MYYKKPNFKAIDIHKKQLMLPGCTEARDNFDRPRLTLYYKNEKL